MRCTKFVLGLVVAGTIGIVGCADSSPSNSPAPETGGGTGGTASPVTEPTTPVADPQPDGPDSPSSSAAASGWGHLKGRFVFDGAAPKPKPLTIDKDQQTCGKHTLVDESLVVDAQTKGVANVVVQLYLKRGKQPPAPHESYEASATDKVVLDNNGCRFEPHVCVVRTSQTLVVKNSDPVGHNTKVDLIANPAFNQTIAAGSDLTQQLTASERRAAAVGCSIHPWMKGWLVVRDTPYVAVSQADGSFEIKNLPAGEWTFQVWHERPGAVEDVSVGGSPTKWSKGRVTVTISGEAATDLGEIKLSSAIFE